MTDADRETFLAEALAGLADDPPTLPCKYFYDARGSRLFERICGLPEYYPTRTERAILTAHADAMAEACGRGGCLIEPGAGSGEKTRIVLRAFQTRLYVPTDISGPYLRDVAEQIAADFPDCEVRPVVGDFTRTLRLPEEAERFGSRTLFFPGSTIGNFAPTRAAELLAGWRPLIGEGGSMLVGLDVVKDAATLEAAYDDAAGVTAEFNGNLLVRLRDDLGADVDPDGFTHRAVWNAEKSRVEMHLVSRRDQTVLLGGRDFDFPAGSLIHTENSHKFTDAMVDAMAAEAGLRVADRWTDDDGLFAVVRLVPA